MFHTGAGQLHRRKQAGGVPSEEPPPFGGRALSPQVAPRDKTRAVLDRARARVRPVATYSPVQKAAGSAKPELALVVTRGALVRCICFLALLVVALLVLVLVYSRSLGTSVLGSLGDGRSIATPSEAELVQSQLRWEHMSATRLMVSAALLERYLRVELAMQRNHTSPHQLVDFVAGRLDAARAGARDLHHAHAAESIAFRVRMERSFERESEAVLRRVDEYGRQLEMRDSDGDVVVHEVSELLSRGGFYGRLEALVRKRASPAALIAARAAPRTEQYDVAKPEIISQKHAMIAANVHHFFVRVKSLENATLPAAVGVKVRALLAEMEAAQGGGGGARSSGGAAGAGGGRAAAGPVSRHAHRDMLQNSLLRLKIMLSGPDVRGIPVTRYDNPYAISQYLHEVACIEQVTKRRVELAALEQSFRREGTDPSVTERIYKSLLVRVVCVCVASRVLFFPARRRCNDAALGSHHGRRRLHAGRSPPCSSPSLPRLAPSPARA